MRLATFSRDIVDGCRSRPGRAAVCVVAVAIGAAALSLMTTTLESLETTSERLVAELGADAIVAVAEEDASVDGGGLGQHHASLLRANLPGLLVSTVLRSEARTLGSSVKLQVIATDRFFAATRQWHIVEGRFLDARDVELARRHAVISHRLGSEWGWGLGHVIILGEVPFVVVGIVKTAGDALAGQFGDPRLALGERLVFVPRTVPPLWSETPLTPDSAPSTLFMRAPDGSEPAAVLAAAQNLLSAPSARSGPISWVTPESLVEGIDRLKTVIGGAATFASLLCLLLGGTTLMSLMLTNVRERVPEIGLRLALGGTRTQVAALFVWESLALTLLGATLGAVAARLAVGAIAPMLPIPMVSGWSSWAVPIVGCALFGLLFSYGPARLAARISPAAALRAE